MRHRTAGFFITSSLVGWVILLSATIATAQSKCDAGKLKEYGKRVLCLAKVDATAAKKNLPVDSAKETKCNTKFAAKCSKAEQLGDCTSDVESCSELTSAALSCRNAAFAPAAVCGDDTADPGEECDGNDDSECPGSCLIDCTCPQVPTPCEATTGGYCWYLGDIGESCGYVCTSNGKVYHSVTATYAGSGGTAAQCANVLTDLGFTGAYLGAQVCGEGVGCTLGTLGVTIGLWCNDVPTTEAASISQGRACACQ
jgi:hypothetical protein